MDVTDLGLGEALALWGVVLSTVYMLRAYRKAFMGTTRVAWKELVDLRPGLRVPITLLVAALLWIGFYPQSFVRILMPVYSTYFAANK